jgi:hypothetical protein
MLRSRLFPLSLSALLLVLVSAPGRAYTVMLKDGSHIIAVEPFEVQGESALVTLQSGAQTLIPMSEIDLKKTEKYNEKNYGTALVVDAKGVRPLDDVEPTPRQSSLADLLKDRQLNVGRDEVVELRRTASGHVDLAGVRRHDLEASALKEDLERFFRREGQRSVAIYTGTQPGRVFLDVTTDTEGAVFRALEMCARSLLAMRQRHGNLEALEVLLRTSSRSRAGQFLLDPENSTALTKGRLSTHDFFVRYVQF